MNLSENLRHTIEQTAQNLHNHAAIAERHRLIFEGVINELRYLQDKEPIISAQQMAAVAQRPDVDDQTLASSYPTPWPDLCLAAISNPTHSNVNHCLTNTAAQITKQSGLPEPQDAHLIPAIIRMFPTVHASDLADDT